MERRDPLAEMQLFDDVVLDRVVSFVEDARTLCALAQTSHAMCSLVFRNLAETVRRRPVRTMTLVVANLAAAANLAPLILFLRVRADSGGVARFPYVNMRDVINFAARSGNPLHLNFLVGRMARKVDPASHDTVCAAAISGNSIACLRILCERGGCVPGEMAAETAVERNDPACLAYILALIRSSTTNVEGTVRAIFDRCAHVAAEHGASLCMHALLGSTTFYGDADVASVLISLATIAAEHNNAECMSVLLDALRRSRFRPMDFEELRIISVAAASNGSSRACFAVLARMGYRPGELEVAVALSNRFPECARMLVEELGAPSGVVALVGQMCGRRQHGIQYAKRRRLA